MRTLVTRVVFVLAAVAAGFTVIDGRAVRELGKGLNTGAAPARIVSLQLAPTTGHARAILHDWRSGPSVRGGSDRLIDDARLAIDRDDRFILGYTSLGIFLIIGAGIVAGYRWWWTFPIVVCFVLAGLFDYQENIQLRTTLNGGPDLARSVMAGRLFAMSKFALLLVGAAATLASIGAALRTAFGGPSPAGRSGSGQRFQELIALENRGIFHDPSRRTGDQPRTVTPPDTNETYVEFREADVIGLALSGGGIRSATFNLGLLQGLHRLKLLRLFDYMATVSGGGYTGAFWSEWLTRQTTLNPTEVPEPLLFPTARHDPSGHTRLVDTPQERHLREFSRFLAPRWGFFEVEMWTAIVAVVGGLLPALLISLCVLGVAMLGWLTLTFPLASHPVWAPAVTLAVVTAAVLVAYEWMWQTFKSQSASQVPTAAKKKGATSQWMWWYAGFGIFAVGLAGWMQARLPGLYAASFGGQWPLLADLTKWQQAPDDSGGLMRWWALTGIFNPGHQLIISPRLFDFAVACLGASMVLMAIRTLYAVRPWGREPFAVFDRILMRLLGLSVFWVTLALVWHAAINLAALASGAAGAAGGALLSGGAFAALRNWIGDSLRRPAEAGVMDRLRPYIPVILAYLTIALSAAAVGAVLIMIGGTDWMAWWSATGGMLLVLVLALFIQTDRFGLHAFYRDRLCRAYAGACNLVSGQGANETAADNRGTEPREGDDRPMNQLVGRPLHLVCCAANDLSGDQVETLGRGARSAVLSKWGVSMGRYFDPVAAPYLGSAITASAAAFNSNMGAVSMRLGPAVTFLMTALNLRLGLWVRHPAAGDAGIRRWPGLLLFREMFGLTSASGFTTTGFESDIHLSDGAHFENLALYELIRRHCRYIIVSDCGADPSVGFDDLGNVLRRVREDFGVDIKLDVSALRPGPGGISAQHVAVGTIHYSNDDKGILLYVKPSITGNEPTDVLQYRTRNVAFPHESTGDQFYDEAQWESYRRLGLHAADCIFDFVARDGTAAEKRSADWVFAEAMHRWGATPDGLEASVLAMTERFGALEADIQKRSAVTLFQDVFPELQLSAIAAIYRPAGAPADAEPISGTETLALLLRVTQLMEDAWLTCKLDEWWSHPLNLGWTNLFARWATCEEFLFWWPLISPMYSPGFRSFIQQRFPVAQDKAPQEGTVEAFTMNPAARGLAEVWLAGRTAQKINDGAGDPAIANWSRTFYQNLIKLRKKKDVVAVQTGVASVARLKDCCGWTSDDYFVPPSLWGAGIGWYFLKGLLKAEGRASAEWCYVIVKMPATPHQVAKDDYRSFLQQYRKIGFREVRDLSQAHGADSARALCDALKFDAAKGDTLLELNLAQWVSLRS